jgi:uncharacterized protein YeeX (DUF496 family)
MNNLGEVKAMCQSLKETAEEIQEILSNEQRNNFAIGFLKYVEDTYNKRNDQYYFKNPLISNIHRDLNEVMKNYVGFLNKNGGKQYPDWKHE